MASTTDTINTLPAIAEETGISYRNINATIDSLERQFRVEAVSYERRRGEQVFRNVPEKTRHERRLQYKELYKSGDPSEQARRPPHPRTITMVSAVPEKWNLMFGIRSVNMPDISSQSRIYHDGRFIATSMVSP